MLAIKILIATISIRSYAILVNDLVDEKIDILNPRTRTRPLPSGMNKKIFLALIITSISAFLFTAYTINKLCFYLSWIPALLFFIYPYMKKFTYLTHIYLGAVWGLGCIGGYIAIKPEVPPEEILLLYFTYLFWLAGSDAIYSTMDYDFDKKYNLKSIPVKYGIKKALKISFFFHVLSTLFYYSFLKSKTFTLIYFVILLMQNIFWRNYKFSFNVLNILLNFYIFITIFVIYYL